MKRMFFSMSTAELLSLTVLLIGNVLRADGNVYYVDAGYAGAVEDGSVEHPFKAIQQGVDACTQDYDYVIVRKGRYVISSQIEAGARQIQVNQYLSRAAYGFRIVSDSTNPRDTIVDCQGLCRGFLLTNSVEISGFTVTNGFATLLPNSSKETSGGGFCLYSKSGAVVSNCVITCCRAESGVTKVSGGGLYAAYNASVFDTRIEDCRAEYTGAAAKDVMGGGLYASAGNTYSFRMSGCHVLGNETVNAASQVNDYGGGLYVNNNNSSDEQCACCVVSNCVVQGNCCQYAGGGILAYAKVQVVDCRILDNQSTGTSGVGAGVNLFGAGNRILYSRVTGNASGKDAGGVQACDSIIGGCAISNNSATAGVGGGVCMSLGAACSNSLLRLNSARQGGGISIGSGDGVVVTRCQFEQNEATRNGGGVYAAVNGSNARISVRECAFLSNRCGDDYEGSAIHVGAGNEIAGNGCDIRLCSFFGNQGGSVLAGYVPEKFWEASAIRIESCTIASNASQRTAVSSYQIQTYPQNISSIWLRNVVFADNVSEDSPELPDLPGNMSTDYPAHAVYSYVQTAAGLPSGEDYHNVLGRKARFSNPAAGDYHPKKSSPIAAAGLWDATWMSGAEDMGSGWFQVEQNASGVTLRKVQPRPIGDAKSQTVAIGCLASVPDCGMMIILR